MRYRMNAAKDMLQHTDLSVQEIADATGFNSHNSFYLAFKEHVSMDLSPTEWRKQRR